MTPVFRLDSCGNDEYRCGFIVLHFGSVLVADEMFEC